MYRFDPHLRAHAEEAREVRSRAAAMPPEPKKGLFASIREQAESTRGGNGNGSPKNPTNGTGGAAGGPSKPATGRVTQPGRPNNASRKRSKKRR
jgi:hypothetical protein